jgi:rubrerythrin
MAQQRMIDFLKAVESFYGRLAAFYEATSDEAIREDVKTVLIHLRRHEGNVRSMIQRYEEDTDQTILNTWFKISPDFTQLKTPDDLAFDPSLSVDEVIQLAIDVDNSLIDMYKLLVRESLDDDVKDALKSLIQEELSEEIKLMNVR